MAGASRLNLLPICLSVLTLSALFGLPLLRVAPNRLVSGDPLFASAVIPGQVWAMLALLLGAALIATYKSSRWWLGTVVAISAAMIPILLWFAASNASLNAQDGASVTRTSFGSAFWISTVLLAFLASSTLEQLNAAVLHRVTLALVVLPHGYLNLSI